MEETLNNEQLESIKLTKNAKGDMQYEIKIYAKEALEKKDPVASRLALEKIVNYINDIMGWE